MQSEFPELIQIESIGTTWEHRDINVIVLDAQKFVNSEAFNAIPLPEKKVSVQVTVTNQTTNSSTPTNATLTEVNSSKKEEEEGNSKKESDEDVYWANKAIEQKKKMESESFQNKFDKVSDNLKEKAFSDALGLDFVQISSHLGKMIKKSLRHHKKQSDPQNLVMLSVDDDDKNNVEIEEDEPKVIIPTETKSVEPKVIMPSTLKSKG